MKKDDPHFSKVRAIALETPNNEIGGIVIRPGHMTQIKKIAKKNKLRLHLDGARALNAAGFLKISPAEMCKDFDTVSFCMSKFLGTPFGSVVMGTKKDITDALGFRKALGGNLRQAGIICHQALENLETWEDQVKADHELASFMADELKSIDCLELSQESVETNMFYMQFKQGYQTFNPRTFSNHMAETHRVLFNSV